MKLSASDMYCKLCEIGCVIEQSLDMLCVDDGHCRNCVVLEDCTFGKYKVYGYYELDSKALACRGDEIPENYICDLYEPKDK